MSNNTFNNNQNENEDDSNLINDEDKYYDGNYSMNVSYNADTDTSKLKYYKINYFSPYEHKTKRKRTD